MSVLITDGLPDGVPLVADFDSDLHRLDHYYPQLDGIDGVRTPGTTFVDVSVDGATPTFDEGEISEWMISNNARQAFVRGMYASAKFDVHAGSHIQSQDRHDVRRTVANLVAQHVRLERPLGGRIGVREWLDLEYCPDVECVHETEVRYFVDGGDVLYRFPSEDRFVESSRSCSKTYDYVRRSIDDVEYPDEQAQLVADHFDDLSWSVDFVRHARTREWFCTDMGLNGLYYHPANDRWIAISEHRSTEDSPERYADELDDELTERFK